MAVNYFVKLEPTFVCESSSSITLSSNQKEVILGRSDVTGITDKRCSREQMKLKLDTVSDELVFSHSGSNPGCILFDGKQTVLCKYDVKRLPLNDLGPDKCSIYLIHKDLLYEYKISVKVKKEEKTKSNAEPIHKRSTVTPKGESSKKRPISSTLDSFVIKKARLGGEMNGGKIPGVWTEPSALTYFYESSDQTKGSTKIAGFDMDGTLITTASGAKWPKDKDDWKLLFPSVPEKLKSLHDDGYKLVIFTNQGSIARNTVKAHDIQHKIEAIINEINVPMQAMIAGSKKGKFRKPFPGMWTYVCDTMNNGIETVDSSCVYVGDAAGRVAGWKPGKKKDFANSDRLFAANAGVRFATPESFFLGEKEGTHEMPEFNPSEALKVKTLLEPVDAKLCSGSQELIVMVGFPGSGKSTVATKLLKNYQRVCRDLLGSWQKCVARCEQELKSGKCVIIDNTNPDKESRARYTEIANKYKVPVRCFFMSTSYKQSRHNEVFRQCTNKDHKPINDMIVHSYKSKFTPPELSEGFTQIVTVNPVLKFENEEQERIYSMYLLEK